MPFTAVIKEDPLRPEIKELNLTLWEVRLGIGGLPSEAVLSRTLRGIDPMTPDLRKKIQRFVDEVKRVQQDQQQPAAASK